MHKSIESRLAALEQLEAEQARRDVSIDAMSDDEVLAAVFDGLRSLTLFQLDWRVNSVGSDYWIALAERANAIYERDHMFIIPITPEETQCALAALQSGAWVLRGWPGKLPSNGYAFAPPTPYPLGCWETPEYAALLRVVAALRVWDAALNVRPETCLKTTAQIIDWLASIAAGRDPVCVPFTAGEARDLLVCWQRGDLRIVPHPDRFSFPHLLEYAVERVLRRPTGEEWNTQADDETRALGFTLCLWAVQRGDPLTDIGVMAWLTEIIERENT